MKQFFGIKTAIVNASTNNRFTKIPIKAILKIVERTEMPVAMPISMSVIFTIDLLPQAIKLGGSCSWGSYESD